MVMLLGYALPALLLIVNVWAIHDLEAKISHLQAQVDEMVVWKRTYQEATSWGTAAGVRDWLQRHAHDHEELFEEILRHRSPGGE